MVESLVNASMLEMSESDLSGKRNIRKISQKFGNELRINWLTVSMTESLITRHDRRHNPPYMVVAPDRVASQRK
jgi:hypothetical protein